MLCSPRVALFDRQIVQNFRFPQRITMLDEGADDLGAAV